MAAKLLLPLFFVYFNVPHSALVCVLRVFANAQLPTKNKTKGQEVKGKERRIFEKTLIPCIILAKKIISHLSSK